MSVQTYLEARCLLKELNDAIGTLQGNREYLEESAKLLVDVSIKDLPTVLEGNKANIVKAMKKAEAVMQKAVLRLIRETP